MTVLQVLQGMKTLIACVLFLGVTFVNKRWKLGIEPTAIGAGLAATIGVLRMFPSKPLTPQARKVAVVLIGLSAVLATVIQAYPKQAVEIMRYEPTITDTELQPESAPTTPPALPALGQGHSLDAGQASGSGDIVTDDKDVNDFPDASLVPDAVGQIKEDSNVEPQP